MEDKLNGRTRLSGIIRGSLIKNLRWLLQIKLNFKIAVCSRLSGLRLFRVDHVVYGKGEVSFQLIGTNGFRVKAENERFIAVGSRCLQNLK